VLQLRKGAKEEPERRLHSEETESAATTSQPEHSLACRHLV